MKATIILFGVTGDLSNLKIIPSLYHLILDKRITDFAVVGIGRREITAEQILKNAKPHFKTYKKKVFDELKKRFYYFRGDVFDHDMYHNLHDFVDKVEHKHRLPGNRLFYLAVLPNQFGAISEQIQNSNLAHEKKGWSRIVFEKPFGTDLTSAKRMNRHIRKLFREDQIYRIDHYLGKELVQNISVLRFTNIFLQPLWNAKHIDHVQIHLTENFGIKDRGNFYDQYGALKDVVQNHVLQLLALTAMSAPKQLSGEHIRNEKVKILKKIKLPKKEDIVIGQYQGYRKSKGVPKGSKTETFAALKLGIDTKEWKGVPFYLLAGKALSKRTSSIIIRFKEPPCLMFKGLCYYMPNELIIQIQPEEGIYLKINVQEPRSSNITSVMMDFNQEFTFGPQDHEAYETLLLDVVSGNQSVFIRSDEIEHSWKLIDHVKKLPLPLTPYKQGQLPQAAEQLLKKDGRSWNFDGIKLHKKLN